MVNIKHMADIRQEALGFWESSQSSTKTKYTIYLLAVCTVMLNMCL